jgi:hypothetical protein
MKRNPFTPPIATVAAIINEAIENGFIVKVDKWEISYVVISDKAGIPTMVMTPTNVGLDEGECPYSELWVNRVSEFTSQKVVLVSDHKDIPAGFVDVAESVDLTFHKKITTISQVDLFELSC